MGHVLTASSVSTTVSWKKKRKESGAQRESNNGDEIKSHCVISTSSAHSIKALQEQRFEQCVRRQATELWFKRLSNKISDMNFSLNPAMVLDNNLVASQRFVSAFTAPSADPRYLPITMDVADCSILLLLDQSAAFNSADQTCPLEWDKFTLFYSWRLFGYCRKKSITVSITSFLWVLDLVEYTALLLRHTWPPCCHTSSHCQKHNTALSKKKVIIQNWSMFKKISSPKLQKKRTFESCPYSNGTVSGCTEARLAQNSFVMNKGLHKMKYSTATHLSNCVPVILDQSLSSTVMSGRYSN